MTDEFDSKIEEDKIIDFHKVDEYMVEAKYKNFKGSFMLVSYKDKLTIKSLWLMYISDAKALASLI